ncbi:hypothetical protein [Pseudooceanicola aestuarii]|uniref:hypothetical protein n=1 Tax=Pseudooceanicola aestuarii TaxID=2697319 RepID=UPI001EF89B64|nr:hypothetical protein [Pseudooceanicola aestuarii]
MTLQLLCRFDTTTPEVWEQALAADAEDQRNAGLTLLQRWWDADAPGSAYVLFEVNDRPRAEEWITRARADTMGRPTGVTDSTAHFLRTA